MTRIPYIDALKGFAILWVVLGHIAEHSFDIKASEFNHFYPSFHMPLFMFLSGIFALHSFRLYNASESLLFLRKKALRILIPFAVIGGGNALIFSADAIGGYWFLPALFYCMITCWIVELVRHHVSRPDHLWGDILLHGGVFMALFAVYTLGWASGIPFFLAYVKMYPFFVMGMLFGRYDALKQLFSYSQLAYAVAIAGYLLFWFWQPPFKLNFTGFFAIIILLQLFIRFQDRMPAALTYMGRYSLEIYIFHWFFLPSLPRVGEWLMAQSEVMERKVMFVPLLLLTLLLGLAVIACCLCVAQVVHHNKYLRLIVLGEVPQRPNQQIT